MGKKKSDKKALSEKMSMAVPADLVGIDPAKLRKQKIKFKKAVVRVSAYDVEAYVFTINSDEEMLDLYVKAPVICSLAASGVLKTSCLFDNVEIPFFAGKPGPVEIYWDKENQEEDAGAQKEQYAEAMLCYKNLLEQCSGIIGGIAFHLHIGGEGDVREPFPDSPRCIHIFCNKVPLGEVSLYYRSTAFNLPLSSDGKQAICLNSAPGRGIAVKDDKKPVVQILGSNFYFLAPIIKCFNAVTSGVIFIKLLSASWKAYQQSQKAKKSKSAPLKRKAFMDAAFDWQAGIPEFLEKKLVEDKAQMDIAFREIMNLQSKIRDAVALLDSLKASGYSKNIRSRVAKEWKKITALSDVSRLAVVENGLHVFTKPIVIKWEGKSYDMGSYVIRINKCGYISVWSENSTHPQGVPHPHIGKETGACYGNATEAIIRAGTEHRYADAFAYIIRWLKYGYTAELTLVKIEEWPVISKISAAALTVADKEKQEVAV